jgi:UDP-glucose 4-epimerase
MIIRAKDTLRLSLAGGWTDLSAYYNLYGDVNIIGAEYVCNVCTRFSIKNIIFTSSVAVYGFAPVGPDETGTINYFNDYRRTKWN